MPPSLAPLSSGRPSIPRPLIRSTTLPVNPTHSLAQATDRALLAPEDAINTSALPKWASGSTDRLSTETGLLNGASTSKKGSISPQRGRHKERGRGDSRHRRRAWKKLLWVKQTYPDNYTDQDTFLEQLQRNPRLQPYDFWPLVADSTVIVQHVCSVIIFIICFVAIFQERVSPSAVLICGTVGTVFGWLLWDSWLGQDHAAQTHLASHESIGTDTGGVPSSSPSFVTTDGGRGLGLSLHSPGGSTSSLHSQISAALQTSNSSISPTSTTAARIQSGTKSLFSPRNQQRLATAKSALLIYCALLGLSPILKSLTKSTSSDSIWALTCWLILINVFFFDYGSGPEVKFPTSLSTNAALMASTVLASRLPSTQHVFSLTLFSIEVFGLFPVFRRHLRHRSWTGHLALTIVLVTVAGGGVGIVVSGGGWKAALLGLSLGNVLAALAMGGCSWWLIGLQKYKNEIHGPWDPARPIIRRHWDSY